MKTTLLSLGLAVATLAGIGGAQAQYYPGQSYPPQYYPAPRYAPPVELGYSCYTSRGTCGIPRPRGVGAPCNCYIPGFGAKRGVVQP